MSAPEPRSDPAVRPVEASEVRALSTCLAMAFEDDPVSCYLFPSRRTRLRRLERYFNWQFGHVFLPKGEAWTTSDLAGASLWMPPGRRAPTVSEALGQLAAVVRILGVQTGRAIRLLEQLEAAHPKTAHYYLGTIGIHPDRQGSGIGSGLLRVVLDRLDDEAIAAYLESSKEENLAFYHRHGFEVTGEIGQQNSGLPRIWLMWREPKTSSSHSHGL
ncbi:MAG: GNAT family N-acetyltransferase [Acidimicrobiales bacterium]